MTRTLLFCTLLFSISIPTISAQDAKPGDQNAVNTASKPGDMMADSPIKFPAKGPLPTEFTPDLRTETIPTEEGYFIMSSPCRSLSQIDRIQSTMPKGTFNVPENDWAHLTQTRRLLTEGGALKILALGDSIVNDTMRSGWVGKLAQAYPRAHLNATVYVRGGGNCGHFKQDERISKNVLPLEPDLVLIGGISQRSIDDIREVIRQLRSGLPEVEILLLTGTFGTIDPRDTSALAAASHSGTGSYGRELKALADETSSAYLDMTTPWSQFIVSTGLHPHHFYRDVVHANAAGEQILANILMAFFKPSS